jgi:hypothetical protein
MCAGRKDHAHPTGCHDDSNAAYVQALLWYVTGNQAYANNAIDIC